MNYDLIVRYPNGNDGEITCAHCGGTRDSASHVVYFSCDCPGHLKCLIIGFDEMPNLPERLNAFEDTLEAEPCQNHGGCLIISNSQRMCAPCRLRLTFFHTIYNWDAYNNVEAKL